ALFNVCSHTHHGSFEAVSGVGRTIPLGLANNRGQSRMVHRGQKLYRTRFLNHFGTQRTN
ncbi:hypothetical protein, partial [Neptunomonas sp.]|uniref:hypothetical protein n=1 Tax=Neptunomonas sp. TaxID=1971898 RepID=UPI003564F68C